jgi:endonuclease YncB( thermonuclease family)
MDKRTFLATALACLIAAVLAATAVVLVIEGRKPATTEPPIATNHLVDALAEPPGELAGSPRIIDVDDLELGAFDFRLLGIDAVESGQTCCREGKEWDCGGDAVVALARLIGDRPVTCVSTGKRAESRGKKIRYLAYCYLDGEPRHPKSSINHWLVKNGWAIAYEKRLEFLPVEREARDHRIGYWTSKFLDPKVYRAQQNMPKHVRSKCSSNSCQCAVEDGLLSAEQN